MKNNNKASKSKSISSQRETKVLLEEIHHNVKTVAEGHGVLIRKLEEHDKKFVQIVTKLEEHDKKFVQIDQRFDRVESAIMGLNTELKMLNTIEEKLDQNLENHEKRLTRLEEKTLA